MDNEEVFLLLQCLNEWNELAAAIDEVAGIEREMARLKALAQQIKDHRIYPATKQVLSAAHAQGFFSDAATFLYWNVEYILPSYVKAVANSSQIRPAQIPIECRTCGQNKYKTVVSRTAMESELRFARTHNWSTTCEECKARESAHYTAERRQHEAQRIAEVQHLRAMPYADYLKTEHWQGVRKRALYRAQYRCQVCNTNRATLHVHHRTYKNRGQEQNADVIVLCENCHETFHTHGELNT